MEELNENEMAQISGGNRMMWELIRQTLWAANGLAEEIGEALKMRNGVDSGVGVQNQA
jgi:bacteriocin-like protein